MNSQKNTYPPICIIFVWGLVVAILLASCGAKEQADEVEVTQSPPTLTHIVAITDTPEPTVTPTQTPEPVIQTPLIHVRVPVGNAVELDGIISPGEWDSAIVETFLDGSELFLMHADGVLYLAIRSNTPEIIAGNVFIAEGDKIRVFHSSAALGTAIYQQDGDLWRQEQNFVWKCRKTNDSQDAQAERNRFLTEEGWLAANGRMGTPNELEYMLILTGDNLTLAAHFLRPSAADTKVPFPSDLTDDTILPTQGGFPKEMMFTPQIWALLEIE